MVCLVALASSAQAATGPAPDPAPTGVRPDAVPGATAPTQSPRVQQPATTVQQPATTVQQTSATQQTAAAQTTAATETTTRTPRRPAKAPGHHRARAKPHKPRRHHAPAVAAPQRPAAIAGARRLGSFIAFHERAATRSSLSDGALYAAGTLLLLFVAAAASVLRLTSRMSGPSGRFG